mmetsp:Transcript_55538/g.159715  ORF Transcript_55538/g.159715 Transcript_55538/m.159715 type:complete len:663 (+) Transcript_55538:70-2058(+)
MLSGLRSFVGLGGSAPAAADTPNGAWQIQAPLASPLPSPKRTSEHSTFRSRCSERNISDDAQTHPVKLVVFDLDETLTLVSYMVEENDTPEVVRELVKVNFETPWVDGSRIAKLQDMFEDMKVGKDGERRLLAILSRNSNGAEAVLRLLQAADLASAFCVIWTMPCRQAVPNGAFQSSGGTWTCFRPPLTRVHDHKADVLHAVSCDPATWFPQAAADKAFSNLSLSVENIVLVDDQRANFQSPYSGRQVCRYCKVARYDATYRSFGMVKNMGGIGARTSADYETLVMFVDNPSSCKETLELRCVQRNVRASSRKHPVKLVVFDFDETLTLATFFPEDDVFGERLDWDPAVLEEGSWSRDDLLRYNFESPYVAGSRIQKLQSLLAALAKDESGQSRPLAVLTRNESGAVSVLNLLRMANLDRYFSAIWTLPYSLTRTTGVFQVRGEWRAFEAPVCEVADHKANVLRHIVEHPLKWFPQLAMEDLIQSYIGLLSMTPESVVLVDDERASFQNNSENPAELMRFCKVARYDEIYRNCGPLNQMGGIGAHSDTDYEHLLAFVQSPWRYSQDVDAVVDIEDFAVVPTNLQRESLEEEGKKVLRVRRPKSLPNPELYSSPRGSALKRVSSSPSASPLWQCADPGQISQGLAEFDLVGFEGTIAPHDRF